MTLILNRQFRHTNVLLEDQVLIRVNERARESMALSVQSNDDQLIVLALRVQLQKERTLLNKEMQKTEMDFWLGFKLSWNCDVFENNQRFKLS